MGEGGEGPLAASAEAAEGVDEATGHLILELHESRRELDAARDLDELGEREDGVDRALLELALADARRVGRGLRAAAEEAEGVLAFLAQVRAVVGEDDGEARDLLARLVDASGGVDLDIGGVVGELDRPAGGREDGGARRREDEAARAVAGEGTGPGEERVLLAGGRLEAEEAVALEGDVEGATGLAQRTLAEVDRGRVEERAAADATSS